MDLANRGGAVYVAVLMASLIVASLAMAGLQSTHYFARSKHEEADYGRCQMAADAALEWAIARLNADPNWRSSHVHNVDVPSRQLGGVTVCYRLIDADKKLADDPLDPCDLLVTASTANAACCWRAELAPAGTPRNCLSYALAAQQDIAVAELSVCATDARIASEKRVDVKLTGSLTAHSYAGNANVGVICGSRNTLSGSLEIPDQQVLKAYTVQGTSLDPGGLPVVGGDYLLQGHLLTPHVNSLWGVLDPQGIYVLDCAGRDIIISNCRMCCTLVLLNAGGNSAIADAVYWEAAQPSYPTIMSDNRLELRLDGSPLKESLAGRNFNPPEAPYRGQVDTNQDSIYPSQIRGLIYADNDILVRDATTKVQVVGGILSTKRISVSGKLNVSYRDLPVRDPPPGFRRYDQVRIAPGSVRRVAKP